MKINDFKLEVFFGKHEFSTPYLLTQSDCESMSISDLLALEKDSKKDFFKTWLGYTEVPGDPELRKAIAELYTSMDMNNIIVHSGAQEPIFNFMNVLLEKEDHVITQFPTYQSLFEVANSIGCEVTQWSIEQGKDGWNFSIGNLENLLKSNTKLIVLNSPNNPTGYSLNKEEIEAIAEISRKNNIYVFCDEVYKGLELDGIDRPWFADEYEKGISLGVMSKSYGLAGLRIGWVATKDENLLNKMTKMKHYTTICCSAPSEKLSLIALKHSCEILDRNQKIIEDNIEIANSFFEKHNNLFLFNKPMAGPVAFIKMNIKKPIDEFCNDLVEEQGVLLLPANIYKYSGQYFRIGFGRKNFKESLDQFENYLIKKGYVD